MLDDTMHAYKEKLDSCGVQTGNITFLRIGRSVYSYLAYVNANGDWSMALKPCYRTDWVTATDAGSYPALLPAQYKRSPNCAVFVDPVGQVWFIAGWSNAEQVLWFHPIAEPGKDPAPRFIQMHVA